MKKNEKELDTFFLAFCGQQVAITVNMNVQSPEQSVPLFYEGILLDYDENYYYLGNGPEEITQAVKKEIVVHIMLSDQKNMLNAFLEQMPGPVSEEDIN